MNYQKALIETYNYGVQGSTWQFYKTINEEKQCVPFTPSGPCNVIKVNNVFAQGSCDAVLMAWPLVDADNKQPDDQFTTKCFVEGIPINRLSFVDDLSQFTRTEDDTNERNIENEVFERKNRLNFKISKCKVMRRLKKEMKIYLNGKILELVDDHTYLGTIVSHNGERVTEMNDRIQRTKSVANEIV